ncbi:MAG: CsbD family protein [Isosphaeraceae bacterium]|nr:CsbD family protein [Isosphaeraceae bacterium]
MNWDQIEGRWKQLKGRAKEAWGRMTSDLGQRIAGARDRLGGEGQEQFGEVRDWAKQAVESRPLPSGPQNPTTISLAQDLALVGLGAGLMYYLDPDRGRRRRALVRDQLIHALHELDDAVEVTMRDFTNRARGFAAKIGSQFTRDDAPDEVLVERVRAKLGRVVSHPHSIEVKAHDGRVMLSGPVLAHEVDDLLEAVASVRGVIDVEDRLEVHKQPGDVPGLQGGRPRPGIRPELQQINWSPTARLLVGTAGTALLAAGARRRGMARLALGTLGAGLLARAVTNIPLRSLVGVGAARRMVTGLGRRPLEVRKTIHIAAPVEDVFAAWANYENFPHFLSRVREVRDLGNGRSHWVVAGPAGTTVEWNAVMTQYIPNEVIAWGSEPDAEVQHSGIVHFWPTPDGGTQVSIQLSYCPPAGALGHGLAWLFGADPKHQLDEDLVRMKTFLETGIAAHDASQPAPSAARVAPRTAS